MSQKTEKPIVLDKQEVEQLLPKLDIKALMKGLFLALSQGKAVQPEQTLTLFPEGKGDNITYLGVLAEEAVYGVKLSPYIVTEQAPVITAWTNLMSMKTGQPLLLCDSEQLTIERTAGTTALAVDCLAKKQANQLAVIGAGNIALAHLRHVLSLREWNSIKVFAPELKDSPALQDKVCSLDSRVQVADSSEQATKNADVMMLCTSSAGPVISEQQIKPDALITSISTNAVNAHEIPPQLLVKADVYCDYKQTTPASAGEMCLAKAQFGWQSSSIKGDLADLVSEQCDLPDYDKPVFFRSIGLGLEDVAIANGIWKLVNNGK